MPTIPTVALAAFVLAQGAPPLAPERAPSQNEEPASRPTLADVSALVTRRTAGEPIASVGPIALAGFNHARTMDLGGGRSLMAISCNLGGGLLAFDAGGRFVAARRTWEQQSVQIVDLDGDGADEVITIEKDEAGSGIAGWMYHVYRLAASGWQSLWSGVSAESVNVGSKRETHEGFLRFVDPGTSRVRLLYVERSTGSPNWSRSEWVLDGNQFRRTRLR